MRALPALLFACSCGLDQSGVPPTSNDASVGTDVVVSPDAQNEAEASPPQACSLDAGACVANLPPGWELVAFDPAGENACPSNYASASVFWNVSTQPGVCDCGCTVTKTPACDVGSLQCYVSTDNSCSNAGSVLSVNGPGCTAYPSNAPLSAYAKSTPLAPSGGTCTGDAIKNTGNVAKNNGVACKVPPSCAEQFCTGDVPAGLQSCIQTSGTQTCPTGWSNPVFAGDDFTFDCSTCSCDVNGASTCGSATLDIFSDTQCNSSKKLATMPIDGTCIADSAQGQDPFSFEYHATLTQGCNATGPKTPTNVQLVNARTICCK